MNEIVFLGKKFQTPLFLSASPITSTTCIQQFQTGWSYDLGELERKIKFILEEVKEKEGQNKLIGAIVLKTVYYPAEQSGRDASNTRVWHRSSNDFFHVGHTPREMLNLEELKEFLERDVIKKLADRIIISLGIKHSDIYLWEKLWDELFLNNNLKEYDVIEINARHTLREINMIYLGDRDLDEYVINPVAQSVWNIVFQWFNLLNNLGNEKRKRLLIKLPFRSDLLILCQFINEIIAKNNKYGLEFGIKGVTLINTIKSPTLDKTSSKSEDHLLLCDEEVKLQQMSGYSLKALRNWAIKTVNKKFQNIEISASGGLFTKEDIIEAELFGAKTFQLCSLILESGLNSIKNLLFDEKELSQARKRVNKIGGKDTILKDKRIYWEKNKCCRCMRCLKTFYCDAFVNKYLLYYKNREVKINGKGFYIPYTFFPKINPDYCTGCGLCIQVCPTGALQYRECDILLVSDSPRRKRLLKELTDEFLSMPAFLNEKEEIDKLKSAGENPEEIAKEIALKKARAKRCRDFRVIIGADTLIVLDGEIIGKPENEKEAEEILKKLNEKTHKVITAVALIDTKEDKEFVDFEMAEVEIHIPEGRLSAYIKSKNWQGKAGGYNIEEFESANITKGDMNTVIGLPINKLKELFKKAGLEYLIKDK